MCLFISRLTGLPGDGEAEEMSWLLWKEAMDVSGTEAGGAVEGLAGVLKPDRSGLTVE